MIEIITASLFKFYGLDWLATIAQLTSMYLIAEKRRSSFIWKGASTLLYMGLNFLIGSAPAMAIGFVFLWMNYRAWRMWGQDG